MDFLVAQPYDMVGGAGVEPASLYDTLYFLITLDCSFPYTHVSAYLALFFSVSKMPK